MPLLHDVADDLAESMHCMVSATSATFTACLHDCIEHNVNQDDDNCASTTV